MHVGFKHKFVDKITRLAITIALFLNTNHDCVAQVPCRYEVTHFIQAPVIGFGHPPTFPTAISPSGRYVCGYYTVPTNNYPFLYDTQTRQFLTLPVQPSHISSANDVNEEYVVGQAFDKGFMYKISTGQVTYLPPAIPNGECTINGINSSNVVCGTRTLQLNPLKTTAFRWSIQSGIQEVGLINNNSSLGWDIADSGRVVGHFPEDALSASTRAMIFDASSVSVIDPIPGGFNSRTRGVGSDGKVLIMGLLEPAPTVLQRTFVYDNKYVYELQVPVGCDRTYSTAINQNGVSTGGCSDLATGTWRGVTWYGDTPLLLNAMIDPTLDFYIYLGVAVTNDNCILSWTSSWDYAAFATILAPVARFPGDTNCDELVNASDIVNIVQSWGPCNGCDADLNADQIVNVQDLLAVISNWAP